MTKLHRAEGWIRKYGESESGSLELSCGECLAIAQELDRLRAEVAALNGEAERTVYVNALNQGRAISRALNGCSCVNDITAFAVAHPDEHVYAVRLSATKVQT